MSFNLSVIMWNFYERYRNVYCMKKIKCENRFFKGLKVDDATLNLRSFQEIRCESFLKPLINLIQSTLKVF